MEIQNHYKQETLKNKVMQEYLTLNLNWSERELRILKET